MKATSSAITRPLAERQPAPGRRSPNCHALTARPPSCAKNTAASTNPMSCTTVSAIDSPGGVCELVIFTPSASAGQVDDEPAHRRQQRARRSSAAGAVHGGHAVVGRSRAIARSGTLARSIRSRPPSARSRTGPRSKAISARRQHEHGALQARALGEPRREPDAEREQHQQEARQRHQRLRADRVGERQRQRGDHVRAVCERQPAQRRRRSPGSPPRGRRTASGCARRSRTGCPCRSGSRRGGAGTTAAGGRPRTPPSSRPRCPHMDRRSACSRLPVRAAAPAGCRPRARGRRRTGPRPAGSRHSHSASRRSR